MNAGQMHPVRPSGPLEICPALPILARAEAGNADQAWTWGPPCVGSGGRGGAHREKGGWTFGSQSCCPPGRPARTPAPSQALWHRVITAWPTQAAGLPARDKPGSCPERRRVCSCWSQLRGCWTPLPPRGPGKAKPTHMDTWGSPDAGPGGSPHVEGGGRKREMGRPQDTAP